MAAPKGHKKYGGRKKGTPNKDSLKVEEIAQQMGCDPFKILCSFAMGDWKALGYDAEMYFVEKSDGAVSGHYVVTSEMRLKAAQEACKYLFSQKKAVEHSTSESGFKVIIEDYRMIRNKL